MELRPYQTKAIDAVEATFANGSRSTLIVLATGCHALGEQVLTADGNAIAVENVRLGDALLGADGFPRQVLALHKGTMLCYKIIPVKGRPFVVTEDHMLTLVHTVKGTLVDISVKDWMAWNATQKHNYKLIRSSALEFYAAPKSSLPIPPYVLGILLGDGGFKYSSINFTTMDDEVLQEMQQYQGSGNKFIPHIYLTANIKDRLELLAGLVDSDGNKGGNTYDYICKSKRLAEDIAFLCRSLGFATYLHACKKGIKERNFIGEYYRLNISGETSIIPCRITKKQCTERKQKKNVLRTGFSVEAVGKKEYIGFTVDGDNRYLLSDFTITHNCGKTIIFSNIAAREVRKGGRVLILAHRGELLDQAIDKLYKATGIEAGLEKANTTSDTDILTPPYTVVVGSVQSMKSPQRLARFNYNEFSLIVIDECHHALTNTYRAVIDHFPNARLLGVTATPDRGDMRSLSEVFQNISFEYSLIEAIRDGYLSPIHAQTIPLRIDITSVAKQGGDYQAAGLGAALIPYLHQICREIKARCADRKTIVFTPLISISLEMKQIFNEEGITEVREVDGASRDRAETLEWFSKAPKGCVLLNSMLLTEGYDEPSVDCIVVLRATKVRSLFVQMIGRGTRLSPETGKKNLLLLDFLWLTSTHDLCRPASILTDDQNLVEEITKKTTKQTQGEIDINPDLLLEAQTKFAQKCKDTLAKRLAQQSHKKGKLFDALEYATLTGTTSLENVQLKLGETNRPTLEQLDKLEKAGLACPGTYDGAEKLLTAYQQRVDKGLTTAGQIRFLESRGFVNVRDWSKDAANRIIRKIAACGWNRMPAGIGDPATYKPY